jgi:hypothetical protein
MAPSFAERLNADVERPRNAPIKTSDTSISSYRKTNEDGTNVMVHQNQAVLEHQTLPPPLPLVLRPPLRKKKSFSRVSSWLFPGQDQEKGGHFESVTNKPMPVKDSEGFYQIVSTDETVGQRSSDSIDTLSTCGSQDEERTAPTTWSPESTPAPKQDDQSVMVPEQVLTNATPGFKSRRLVLQHKAGPFSS